MNAFHTEDIHSILEDLENRKFDSHRFFLVFGASSLSPPHGLWDPVFSILVILESCTNGSKGIEEGAGIFLYAFCHSDHIVVSRLF